jgi:hypothetical protein
VTANSTLTLAGSQTFTSQDFQIDSGSRLEIDAGSKFTMADTYAGTVAGTLDLNGGAFEVAGSSAQASFGNGAILLMRGADPVMTVNPVDGVVLSGNAEVQVNPTAGTGSALIDGSGSVKGANDNRILININQSSGAVLLVLDAATTLHGRMLIDQGPFSAGQSRFDVNGLIVADAPGHSLEIGANIDTINDVQGDCSTFQWQVASGCTLMIDQGLTLFGSFNVSGSLCINGTVTTDGFRSGGGSVTCGTLSDNGTCP